MAIAGCPTPPPPRRQAGGGGRPLLLLLLLAAIGAAATASTATAASTPPVPTAVPTALSVSGASDEQQPVAPLAPLPLLPGRRRRGSLPPRWVAEVRGGAPPGSRRRQQEDEDEEEEDDDEEEEQEQRRRRRQQLSRRSQQRSAAASASVPYDGLSSGEEAVRRAQVEMAVEDHNGLLKLEGGPVFGPHAGHFIVMPMTELLDPPLGSVLHDKLQFSDKVMLPKSFIYEVLSRKLEPPWHFEITPLDEQYTGAADPDRSEELRAWRAKRPVPKLHCSNFDFRAPENYLFLPDWMFRALRLRPRDVVSLKFVRLPEGGLVALQPHTASFSKMANPHAVLESELKYYSCVTKGTTIRFKHNGKEYDLDVVETLGPKDEPVAAIRVQDTDIRTDIRPPKDEEEARKKKRAEQEAAKAKAAAAAASAASKDGDE